jgi:hypothetical protein
MNTTTGRKITITLTEEEFDVLETAVYRWRDDAVEFVRHDLGPAGLSDTLLTLVNAWSRIDEAWTEAR